MTETREDHPMVNAKSCLYSQRILTYIKYIIYICWLCHITSGFYGKRISQLCNINDNGAAYEREKIRQPTCLSANLRLTKTLAPLARNYKIRLSCSSPPTRQFLIIFCGQIVPTWANIASVAPEDSTVKETCCLQKQI